jgi:hypothetical protein
MGRLPWAYCMLFGIFIYIHIEPLLNIFHSVVLPSRKTKTIACQKFWGCVISQKSAISYTPVIWSWGHAPIARLSIHDEFIDLMNILKEDRRVNEAKVRINTFSREATTGFRAPFDWALIKFKSPKMEIWNWGLMVFLWTQHNSDCFPFFQFTLGLTGSLSDNIEVEWGWFVVEEEDYI